jgi:peroxiredoxin
MGRSLKVGARALALAAVAGLFALLVWKIVHQERGTVARKVDAGKSVAAPAFDLPRLEGEGTVSLASLRGKAIVVNFFASWCRPCKREAGDLQRTWERHRDRGLVVLGVDVNDVPSDARKFARKLGMTYPLVHAPSSMYDDWGLTGVPETFFIDRRGQLVDVHVAGPVGDGSNREKFARGLELALRPAAT